LSKAPEQKLPHSSASALPVCAIVAARLQTAGQNETSRQVFS
jgi:hypothetical protein